MAGLALRAAERDNSYHQTLHDFSEQLERLLMMALLVLFGGSITTGGLLSDLSWSAAAYAAVAIFIVRPVSAWFSLAGTTCPPIERATISFFGIRGVGTMYYLAYALQRAAFDGASVMLSAAGLIVVASILIHGVSVTPMMALIDHRRQRGVTARETRSLADGET